MEGTKRVTIRDILKVPPRYLGSNVKVHVEQQLRKTYEDKCSIHGYVLPGSLEDVAIKQMALEQATLRGFVNVEVEFTANVWNPPEKTTVMATVKTANNFGILCAVDIAGREVMHIIVPKQIASIRSTKDLTAVRPGSKLEVVIVRRKMGAKADVLSAIGIVTSDAKLIAEEVVENEDNDTGDMSEGDGTELEAVGLFDDELMDDDVLNAEPEEDDLLLEVLGEADAEESDDEADAEEEEAAEEEGADEEVDDTEQ